MKKPLLALAICFFSTLSFSQWSNNSAVNTVVMNAAGCIDDTADAPRAVIITDVLGNIFCTWSDKRSGAKNVYVQKFDAAGVAQWTANGIRIAASANYQVHPKVAADDAGGCTVVWADSVSAANKYDIKAQRFNNTGTAQWTAGGINICNQANNQLTPRIIPDGSGGYYISWHDKRATISGEGSIYIQRVNSAGAAQFAANGIILTNSFVVFSDQHFLIRENSNAVIVYSHYNGNTFDIKAQKFNTAGTTQWGAAGINVIATNNDEAYFDAAIDNSGNLFVSWESYPPPNYDISDALVQKINSAGVLQWNVNGVIASSAANDQWIPVVAPDNAGGVWVAWEDYRQDVNNLISDIYAQRITTAGSAALTANGVIVCNAANSQNAPKITTDGGTGMVVSFMDERSGSNFDIYAQRMNNAGVAQWANNGLVVANAPNSQVAQDMLVSNSGNIIGFFDDRATANCFKYYMQRLNFDGTLGALNTAVTDISPLTDKLKVYPTLMHSALLVENNNPFAVQMRLMDMNGKIVLQKIIGAGSRTPVNVQHLSAGAYLSDYILKDGRRVKLMLMKQ
jgi:hypothetical protein